MPTVIFNSWGVFDNSESKKGRSVLRTGLSLLALIHVTSLYLFARDLRYTDSNRYHSLYIGLNHRLFSRYIR